MNSIKHSQTNGACCPKKKIVLDEGCIEFNKPVGESLILWTGTGKYVAFTIYIDEELSGNGTGLPALVRFTNGGVNTTVSFSPGYSATYVFNNATQVQILAIGGQFAGTLCYRIYGKQETKSTQTSNLPSPCCSQAKLVVDKFCNTVNARFGGQTYWRDTAARPAEISVFLDTDSPYGANVTINLEGGGTITYSLDRGESRTDSVPNATSLFIAQNGPTAEVPAMGRACITVYRKIY